MLAGCAETQIAAHAVKKAQRHESERQAEQKRKDEGAPPGARTFYKVGEPYQIDGVWYRPKEDFSYAETGIASWYGEDFHGRPTANGEIFNMNAVSAAHRTLQMPSAVRVTNLENGRSLVVRVNDRGPFARGRIIDLSRRGATMLGFYGKGTAQVRVEILAAESRKMKEAALNGERITVAQASDMPESEPGDGVILVGDTTERAPVEPALAVVPLEPPPQRPADGPVTDPLLQQVALIEPAAGAPATTLAAVNGSRVFVQTGSFAQFDNAVRAQGAVGPVAPASINPATVNGQRVFRVRLGPFANAGEANGVLDQVLKRGYAGARVVVE